MHLKQRLSLSVILYRNLDLSQPVDVYQQCNALPKFQLWDIKQNGGKCSLGDVLNDVVHYFNVF